MEDLSPEENASRILSKARMSGGAEVVIDATGVEACIDTGVHALKRGGTFIQVGLGAPNVTFPVAQLCSKEGIYRGSFRYGPSDYNTAVKLLEQGKIRVKAPKNEPSPELEIILT